MQIQQFNQYTIKKQKTKKHQIKKNQIVEEKLNFKEKRENLNLMTESIHQVIDNFSRN